MLWWRKRNEGFEWRDYVRTTILVRREQRRQRIKDVQAAAAQHVKDAGQRGLDAGISGARTAGTGLWSLTKSAAAATVSSVANAARSIGPGLVWLGDAILAVLSSLFSSLGAIGRGIGRPLGPVLEPVLSIVRQPKPALILKVVVVLAGLGAAYRAWTFGFDADAIVAATLAGVSAILLGLAYLTGPERHDGRGRPSGARDSLLDRLRTSRVTLPGDRELSAGSAGLATLALAAVTGAGFALYQYAPSLPSLSLPSAPFETSALAPTSAQTTEGRATAVAGDQLRVAGTLFVLDGIESPEPTQTCERKSGRWRCGIAARDSLASLVRNRRVTCEILGEHESGGKLGRCRTGETDLAESLVRNGSVFAIGGFLSRYAGIESDAAADGKGIWAGTPERPKDFRDKRWAEAQRKAPDGCPIKGRVRSGSKTYVLPWHASYDRVRVSKSRGERWFCSESEAEAAGWSRGTAS